MTGLIRVVKNPAQEKIPANILSEDDEEEVLTTKDIYKELRLRGYQYSGIFRSLKSASLSRNKGHIAWMNNWVTFLDNMLQIMILGINTKDLYVPMKIRKIVIDTKLHQQKVQNLDPENRRKFIFLKFINIYFAKFACIKRLTIFLNLYNAYYLRVLDSTRFFF